MFLKFLPARNKDVKAPLFRKVNTTARGVKHKIGGDYRQERNTKKEMASIATRGSMHSKQQRGLDYTPLFKFLLSKVGENWDAVYSEAVSRLDKSDPIYWLVARNVIEKKEYVRVGESSYYSGLYVKFDGTLQVVNPEINHKTISPFCACCTHTFNGVPFESRYKFGA